MKSLFVAVLAIISVSLPSAADIANMNHMVGRFDAATQFVGEDGKLGDPVITRALGDPYMGGAFIRVQTVIPFPGAAFQFEMLFSHDQFNNEYRVAFLDDLNGYLDIYRGQMDGEVLTLTNANSGTAFPDGQGGLVIGKLEFQKSENGFTLKTYIATTADGPWSPYMTVTFTQAQ